MSDDSPLPISVCLIAGAEAHRIRPTLESVAGWAGEIVLVLNQEVTDGTDRIAGEFGARVFREPWKGYRDQKNSAAAKATREWILGLDADEVVSPELREEIRQVLTNPQRAEGYAAFQFPRLTRYAGRWIRHGDWYPDWSLRLWRRGQAQWTGANLHERLQANGPVGKLRADLLHYSMDSLEHQVQKMFRYAEDFARVCRESGRRVGMVDLLFRPPWRFFRSYILKLGCLDGWQGIAIAWTTAFYTFLRYAKARESQSEPPR